jgi:FtsH-binding integral membrane protein
MRYTFSALPGADRFEPRANAMRRALGKPIRTVLIWQLVAAAAMALAAAALAGEQGALSAAAGSAVSVIAGLAAALVASLSKAKSAGGILVLALIVLFLQWRPAGLFVTRTRSLED